MFGHQDDQHHHHDGDNHELNDNAMQPSVDSVLSSEEHHTDTAQQDFNPALPAAEDTFSTAPVEPEQHDEPVASEPTPAPVASVPTDDLLNIKQSALSDLTPLVGHLDQNPEEKFRTTMMLIQASDNHGMIKDAYEAAQQISDEKVKAQALLDVVNEINYFTQQNG